MYNAYTEFVAIVEINILSYNLFIFLIVCVIYKILEL